MLESGIKSFLQIFLNFLAQKLFVVDFEAQNLSTFENRIFGIFSRLGGWHPFKKRRGIIGL